MPCHHILPDLLAYGPSQEIGNAEKESNESLSQTVVKEKVRCKPLIYISFLAIARVWIKNAAGRPE
jgi:hypothetical protein